MSIKVITFDLDNTLWDVEPTLRRAEDAQQAWLRQHRPLVIDWLGHDELTEFKRSVWQRHPQLAHNVSALRTRTLYELQLAAGYPEELAQVGAEQAFAAFLAERHKVELYEEALAVLESLAGQYKLGALTNGNADIFKTDAAGYFDFAFLAENVGFSKPHPHMFRAALGCTDALPNQVVHVGDDPEHDVAGARAVGFHTVWMNVAGKPWPGGERADREIRSLRELPAAVDGLHRCA